MKSSRYHIEYNSCLLKVFTDAVYGVHKPTFVTVQRQASTYLLKL